MPFSNEEIKLKFVHFRGFVSFFFFIAMDMEDLCSPFTILGARDREWGRCMAGGSDLFFIYFECPIPNPIPGWWYIFTHVVFANHHSAASPS